VINVYPTPVSASEPNRESLTPSKKQVQIVNLGNGMDEKLRKDFLRKQQQLRKTPSRCEDSDLGIHSESTASYNNNDFKVISFSSSKFYRIIIMK
jgi:hypothetical protein